MRPGATRVVVIGGNGNFGARICKALDRDSGFDVVAAGRTAPASAGGAITARLDVRTRDFPEALAALEPNIVIHCAGPFQGQDYGVAHAALAAGAHYVDLSDGREFVTGFTPALDEAAKVADRRAITGASTLPALSSAVVDDLSGRFRQVHEIQVFIAPGQRAARGVATIAGVLSYAGKPFTWLDGGVARRAWGWQELKRVHVAGGWRLAAACNVPDLALFPARYPSAKTIAFRAALESKAQHLLLWTVAGLRRIGVPLPLERGAVMMDRLASMFDRFGGETGGMLVSLGGIRADGRMGRAAWHLTVLAEHGPEIPCMAASLLARKLAAGSLAGIGASPCIGMLTLRDFEPEFERWNISCSIEETLV